MQDLAQAVQVLIALGVVAVVASAFRMTKAPECPPFARRRVEGASVNQLRRDSNAGVIYNRNGFLFRRRFYFVGTGCPPVRLSRATFARLGTEQLKQPVAVAHTHARVWWWFEDDWYWASPSYDQSDVLALVRDRQRRERAKLDRAHMLLKAEDTGAARSRRPHIPRELRRAVFERDGGRCVECCSNFDLQYDHILPIALGGATSLENLQLLCGPCNRAKSDNI